MLRLLTMAGGKDCTLNSGRNFIPAIIEGQGAPSRYHMLSNESESMPQYWRVDRYQQTNLGRPAVSFYTMTTSTVTIEQNVTTIVFIHFKA